MRMPINCCDYVIEIKRIGLFLRLESLLKISWCSTGFVCLHSCFPHRALPLARLVGWCTSLGVVNRHCALTGYSCLFFLFYCLFTTKLQTDGKSSEDDGLSHIKPNTQHNANERLECAAVAWSALPSALMPLGHFCWTH